jgi:hypothetical protein
MSLKCKTNSCNASSLGSMSLSCTKDNKKCRSDSLSVVSMSCSDKSSSNCCSQASVQSELYSCSQEIYSVCEPSCNKKYKKPSCPKYKECQPVELKCGRREVIVPERTVHPKPVKKCLGKKIITPPAFWVKVKVQPKPIEIDLGDITMCSPPIKLKAWKGSIEGQKIELIPKYVDKHCPAVVLKEHC